MRPVASLAVVVLLGSALTALAGPGSASAPPASAGSFATGGQLAAVAATSADDAWAVGTTNSGKTLILHWNGKAWKRTASPSPGAGPNLYGVAAISATNAWAVGNTFSNRGGARTVILHWNGRGWKRVASPSPGPFAVLSGVAEISARNVWAVGSAGGGKPLILHWNGKGWKRAPAPKLNGSLEAVAATSAHNVWATGFAGSPGGAGILGNNRALILHWNGKSWKQVSTHLARGLSNLRGVAATSTSNAWAVGCRGCLAEGAGDPVIEHWNGKAWKRVRGPSGKALTGLWGVAAVSPTSAWVVGTPGGGAGHTTGIVHWNGTTWKLAASPNPGGTVHVQGVAATSATDAWAVGETEATSPFKGVISHWNGAAWN